MGNGIERKQIFSTSGFKVLNDSPNGSFSGYASVFGNTDRQNEVVVKGAFAATLPTFLKDGFGALNHEWSALPVATISEAREDDRGLWVKGEFHSTPDAQAARTITRERLERGKSVGMSIGYKVRDEEFKDGARHLKDLDLFEISLVSVPANAEALVVGVKSRSTGGHMNPESPKSTNEAIEQMKAKRSWLSAALHSSKFKAAAEHGMYFDQELSFECPLPVRLKAVGDPITSGQFGTTEYVARVDQHSFPPSGVLDFITRLNASAGTIRYPQTVTPSVGAASFVAEGATKPEVQFRWAFVPLDLRTCACWGSVTRNVLQDVPSIERALDADLTNAIMSTVANEIINGPSANGFTGILATPGIQSVAFATGVTILDQILAGIALVENSGNGPVTGVILNPVDYASLVNSKLPAAGGYVFSPGVGLPPIERDSHLPQGTGLLANWSAAQLYQRNGVTLVLGLKNDDLTKNLMTARADYRCVLAVTKPAAIAKLAFV